MLALVLSSCIALTDGDKLVHVGNLDGQVLKFKPTDSKSRGSISVRVPLVKLTGQMASMARRAGAPRQKDHEDVVLELAPDYQVRFLKAPERRGDDGKIRKPTGAELKELKGNGKLPGYQAAPGDVKNDQIVELYLVRPKDELKKPTKNSPPVETLPLVSRIVIIGESATPATGRKKKDEKD